MGGSSKKQTVGYKYYVGMHAILCHGPVDKMVRFRIDERDAWIGSSSGGQINVDAQDLFGGEKREGGFSGTIDFETGLPTQGRNSYLQSVLGAAIPAFRGVAGLVFRKCYWGLNPYLKKFDVRAQRIHVRQDGIPQWYDEKAAIGIPNSSLPVDRWVLRDGAPPTHGSARTLRYEFKHGITPAAGNTAPEVFSSYESALSRIRELYGAEMQYVGFFSDEQPLLDAFGEEATGYAAAFATLETCPRYIYLCFASEQPANVVFNGLEEGGGSLFCTSLQTAGFVTIGGPYLLSNIARGYPSGFITNDQIDQDGSGGYSSGQHGHGGLLRLVNGAQPLPAHYAEFGLGDSLNNCNFGGGNVATAVLQPFKVIRVERLPEPNLSDMNPAHIVRECLTDPDWGMGYQEADVDDASFTAAADRLYSEQMGMSLLWDRQVPIEDFVKEVLKHIDAVVYVDRTSGKFVIKLIRDDYSVADLLTLGEDDIERVEGYARRAFGEMVNSVTVNHWDHETGKTASVTADDPALVQMQGCVIGTTVQYPGFTHGVIASRVARRDLRALSAPLLSCTIYAKRKAASLNVGDVFRFAWPDCHDGYVVMRVTGMALGDGRSNKVKITCIEDVFALPSAAIVMPPVASWEDPSIVPSPAQYRVVAEAPYYELVQRLGQTQTDALLADSPDSGFILASAGRVSGAINAIMMVDAGSGYEDSGVVEFSPIAFLAVGVGPGISLLPIVGGTGLGEIRIGSHAQIGVGATAELVRIDNVTETGITVGRGVLDTVPRSHAAGALLIAWDDFAEGDETEYVSGEAIAVKLLPASGSGVLSTAAATAEILTLSHRAVRPYPPGNVRINGNVYPAAIGGEDALSLSWSHRDRRQQTSGVLQDTTVGNVGPEPGTTYSVRIYGPAGSLIKTASGLTGTSYTFSDEASGGNPNWANVVFQIDASGPHGSTLFLDAKGHSIATFGDVRVTTAIAAYPDGCAEFDGNGDYLSVQDSDDFNLGNGDFTVEFDGILTSYAPHRCVIAQWGGGSSTFLGYIFSVGATGRMQFVYQSGSAAMVAGTSLTVPLNERINIAWTRASGVVRFFVNGVMDAASYPVGTINNAATPLTIGRLNATDGGYWVGYQKAIRITKGIAMYVNNYTPEGSFQLGGGTLNGRLRFELESVRSGITSYQKHICTVRRAGYGFNYGELYGGV